MEQLPLGVRLRAASTFASFRPGANAPLIAALEARATMPGLAPVFLYAAPGAGRTHLLQATCALAGECDRRAGYLPLGAPWPLAEMTAGLEQLDVVCLDDLDRVLSGVDLGALLQQVPASGVLGLLGPLGGMRAASSTRETMTPGISKCATAIPLP